MLDVSQDETLERGQSHLVVGTLEQAGRSRRREPHGARRGLIGIFHVHLLPAYLGQKVKPAITLNAVSILRRDGDVVIATFAPEEVEAFLHGIPSATGESSGNDGPTDAVETVLS